MNINLISTKDYFYRENLLIIAKGLDELIQWINTGIWYHATINDISIVNGRGIGFYVSYGRIMLETTLEEIKDLNKGIDEKFLVTLNVMSKYNGQAFPVTSLNRLLDSIRENFICYKIMEKENCIVIKSCTDKAIDEFLKLCDIAYKLKIKSNNDVKKFFKNNNIPLPKIKRIKER